MTTTPPQLRSLPNSVLCHLFPLLSPEVVQEVVEDGSDEEHILRHLLLLQPQTHWIQAVLAESQRQPLLILLRGLPGSGKSTLAQILKLLDPEGTEICSADDFFVDGEGVYAYFSDLLKKAHQWCQGKAKTAMRKRKRLLVVDNTNLEKWEMEVFLRMAQEFSYTTLVVEPDTPWSKVPVELAQKTRHGVPLDKILMMMGRYEPNLSIEAICAPLPRHLKPKITSLKALQKKHADIRQEACGKVPAPTAAKASVQRQDADFESLIQCFPSMNIEEIFPLYLQSNGDMNRAVNLILEHQSDADNQTAEKVPQDFSMVLDAEVAAQMEASFGLVRTSGNFPGALECKIPKALARVIFGYWKREYATQLSLAKVEELDKNERHKFFSFQVAKRAPAQAPEVGLNGHADSWASWDASTSSPITQQDIDGLRTKRAEHFQKAARAFKAKKGGEAFYYSDEGRKLTTQIESMESNYRYQAFLQANQGRGNNSLDLHGMTVSQAVESLEWFLDMKQAQLDGSVYATSHLEIITGRGTQYKARIKPAAMSFLRERNLKYSEANQGSLTVLIKRNAT
eukprot:maker-scaffold22_size673200-snap-gene-5.50 protein:Tk12702 transcript:maker-scaffold22_size673200-snap-gene-5.50-mRNA-1 annotation:"nedd4-binding protein 2 isoform x1"